MCLEFSHVDNPLIRQFYDAYSFAVIPTLGQMVAQDRASYQCVFVARIGPEFCIVTLSLANIDISV